jgi:hypothetical protein
MFPSRIESSALIKHLGITFFIVFIAVLIFAFQPDTVTLSSEPVVVAELFTSEGCSSCPAADKLFGQIVSESEEAHQPFFGIAFHISYWNRLGWKDPYSKDEFTARQRRYADVMKLQSVYTPQVVVNGQHQFVGSNRKDFESALKLVRAEPARYTLSASGSRNKKEITIHYSLSDEPEKEWLHVVWVETKIKNYVHNGENQGMLLKHFNVARSFTTFELAKSDTLNIEIPDDIDVKKGAVILYAQNPNTFKVLGAAMISMENQKK